jgi:hypothetical protein
LIVSAAAADAATVATDGAAALSCDTTGFIFACTSTARVSRWRRRRRARRMRMRAAPTLATRCARMPDDKGKEGIKQRDLDGWRVGVVGKNIH